MGPETAYRLQPCRWYRWAEAGREGSWRNWNVRVSRKAPCDSWVRRVSARQSLD